MNLDFSAINWLAVVVSSVVAFLIGGAWYGALFTKQWIAGYGFTEAELEAAKGTQARNFAVYLLAGFVIAIAMSVLARNLGVVGWTEGLKLGAFVYVGFVLTIHLVQHFSGNYKPAAFFVDASYQLLWFLTTGAIVCGWQ